SIVRDKLVAYATQESITFIDAANVYLAYLQAHSLENFPQDFYSHSNDLSHPGIGNSLLLGEAIAEVIH
ncbi:MAG: hypothetical protein K8I82_18590, partial [Anaerolineae bacterium]|nr:hypothetical protein [Anaerolineae bacterium]